MGAVRFGAFTLDASRRALWRGDDLLSLRPQSFDVLLYLVEHGGRAVPRRELLEKFWPRQAKADDSLAHCIRDIRIALGDDAQDIIRTVHRVGIRLEPPVHPVQPAPQSAPLTPTSQTPAQAAAPAAGGGPGSLGARYRRSHALVAGIALAAVFLGSGLALWSRPGIERPVELTMMAEPSIAVLPFKKPGEGHDPNDASGDLADDVMTELSRTPRGYHMHIRPAPGYKLVVERSRAAGRELGARYLALGSIRREGETRHVNVQLIEAESGRQVWAGPFSYAPGESGAQHRVAGQVARALGQQVLLAESRLPLPAEAQAGHFVILGRTLMGGERGMQANRQAQELFDKALALDPSSVPALLGYARTRVNAVLNRWLPKEEWDQLLDEAEAAIKHAADRASGNPGVHVLRGAYLRARGRDAEAIAAFRHALHINPHFPLAHAELGRAKIEVGLAAEAVAHIEEAVSLSPTDPYLFIWYYWAGMAEAHVGRYRSAVDWLLKARQANRAYPNTVPWLAVAYGGLDDMEEAHSYLSEHLGNFPRGSMSRWRLALPIRHPVVAEQRAHIEALLCHLGAPGCAVTTGSVQ
jgi:DNA-binding winged helix-turn-helix (wHTH) protein/TolB-like protein/cytochrome c-type biogenesis protein CcmH/NrfG